MSVSQLLLKRCNRATSTAIFWLPSVEAEGSPAYVVGIRGAQCPFFRVEAAGVALSKG